MTVEEIIKQAEKLSSEDRKQLLGHFFLKFIGVEKDKVINFLAKYVELTDETKTNSGHINAGETEKALEDFRGAGKHIWHEDAQSYVNKLREDDRAF